MLTLARLVRGVCASLLMRVYMAQGQKHTKQNSGHVLSYGAWIVIHVSIFQLCVVIVAAVTSSVPMHT